MRRTGGRAGWQRARPRAQLGEVGNLIVFGANYKGQLGLEKQDADVDEWKKRYKPKLNRMLAGKLMVRTVACGWQHTVLLTDMGILYTWGANDFGQLGIGSAVGELREPRALAMDEAVQDVACGMHHCLAATATGGLYSWGFDDYDQLGRAGRNDVPLPVDVPPDVTLFCWKVAAGGKHSAALDLSGKVWTWGRGEEGQLGWNDGYNYSIPHVVSGMVGTFITEIACGDRFTLALADTGKVYSWGLNNKGQLGTVGDDMHPALVEGLLGRDIRHIAAGADFSVAISGSGKVFAWGNNKNGRLGFGHLNTEPHPTLVEGGLVGHSVRQVSCGSKHILFLTNSGDVLSCGLNDRGQCGITGMEEVITPTLAIGAQHICHVAAGNEFGIAVPETYLTSRLVGLMKSLANKRPHHDVRLIAGSTTIMLHRPILHARCPKLLREARGRIVKDDALNADVALLVVEFLYSGHVHVPPSLASATVEAASRYGLHRLEALAMQASGEHENPPQLPPFSLLNDLKRIMNDENSCDVMLMCECPNEEGILYSHKIMLYSAGSEFVEALGGLDAVTWDSDGEDSCELDNSGSEDGEEMDIVVLADVKHSLATLMLEYIYTGEFSPVDDRSNLELLRLADKYALPHLKTKCIERIMAAPTELDVAVELLEVATDEKNDNLKRYCYQIIRQGATEEDILRLIDEDDEAQKKKPGKKANPRMERLRSFLASM